MKSNLTVVGLAAVLFSLCAPLAGLAVCSGSAANPLLVPDGAPVVETIPASGVRVYFAQLNAGRSYSLQVTTPANSANVAYTLVLCDAFSGGVATTTDTTATDPPILDSGSPVVVRGGRRLTIAVSSSGLFFLNFTNIDPFFAHPFTLVLVETTLFNPLWSTFGGFETFYRFQNSTNASCNITLRMMNDAGTQVANTTFPIPANSTVPTVFTGPTAQGGLNLANDQAGQAVITHDCPPGAIQVDGFTGRFDLAAPVVLPIRIQAAREHAK